MRLHTIRTTAVLAVAALVIGAFVALPAEAAKKKALKCSPFAPAVEGAAESPVVKITPKATEKAPVEIKIEHGMAGPTNPVDGSDLFNEWKYANIQIFGPASGLYIREEFSERHDIDLYLYDAAGEEVESSGGFNTAPVSPFFDAGGRAGTNYESIPGYPVSPCQGFTIGSNAYLTYGTEATIKIWFGEVVAPE